MHKVTMQVQKGCTLTHCKATSRVFSQVRGEADMQILRDGIMLFIMPLSSLRQAQVGKLPSGGHFGTFYIGLRVFIPSDGAKLAQLHRYERKLPCVRRDHEPSKTPECAMIHSVKSDSVKLPEPGNVLRNEISTEPEHILIH